jgi:hypothetical protein
MDADQNSVHGHIAVTFAEHLTAGRFDDARAMLSEHLQQQYQPIDLNREFSAMVSYGGSAPDTVELISTMDAWPARQINDLGWAYVAISGDEFSEAVSVVVAQENLHALIRELEWGRP